MRPPHILQANMDAAVGSKLTREQCLEILDAPRGASMVALAKKFNVRVSFVQHVRYKCQWMREPRHVCTGAKKLVTL